METNNVSTTSFTGTTNIQLHDSNNLNCLEGTAVVSCSLTENMSNLQVETFAQDMACKHVMTDSKELGLCISASSSCVGQANNESEHVPLDDTSDNNSSVAEVLYTSSSLNRLLAYGSDTSGDEDEVEEDVDESSNDVDSFVFELEQKESLLDVREAQRKKKSETLQDTLKQLGELSLDDLPPVITPNAEVPPTDCEQIGQVASIIDKLVMVETIPNKPAFDIDTLLFLEKGKTPLGYVFDVIGPVTNPMYAVRFNTANDIVSHKIKVDMPVYAAPKSEHSQYVFVQALLKEKGTDASWKDDGEVPTQFQDYSDDESEARVGRSKINRKRNSLDRHRDFEKDMNARNLINSSLHEMRDTYEVKDKRVHHSKHRGNYGFHAPRLVRPNFQTNTSSCAFRPPYTVPPYMPSLNPYIPQFVPGIPASLAPLRFAGQMPQPSHMDARNMYSTHPMVPSPPPTKNLTPSQPQMLYHPEMGLPSTTQAASGIPNLQFMPVVWNGYPPQSTQASVAAGHSDIRQNKKYYKTRRK